jgi:hypothetical protein
MDKISVAEGGIPASAELGASQWIQQSDASFPCFSASI